MEEEIKIDDDFILMAINDAIIEAIDVFIDEIDEE